MSNLTILAFGNFQEKDSSETIIDNFLKNQNVLNVEKKRNNSITFPYNLTENDPTLIKIIFIKNFEKEHKICKLANGYILLIDLEQVDCLDKLNDITQYIKLKCSPETVNSFIIGKYFDNNNKIKSLNKNVINEQIKKVGLTLYNYEEICLNPRKEFIGLLETIFKDIMENKTKRDKSLGKPNESTSRCNIY
jgi:hypothetical protein